MSIPWKSLCQHPANSIVSRLRSRLRVRTRLARFRIACYNIGYRIHPTYDGNPLPPADLVNLVIGTRELAWYQLGGLFNQQAISTFLQRNGTTVESFATMLDFGCG